MMVRPGQTLLELVIASGVIVVSVVAAITLIISTITVGRVSQNRIEAANLAREGVEAVRQIRDSNWIRRSRNIRDSSVETNLYQWDFNPLYDSGNLTTGPVSPFKRLSGNFTLNFANPNPGLLGHRWELLPCTSECTPEKLPVYYQTIFHVHTQLTCVRCQTTRYGRLINITKRTETLGAVGNVEYLDVTVSVSWDDRTGSKTVVAQERLYDWQQ